MNARRLRNIERRRLSAGIVHSSDPILSHVRTGTVRRGHGKTVRSNKKRCNTLADIAPIRASRSSVKKILLKNS